MNIKEQIKAEIERRIKEHKKEINKHPRPTLISETMLKGSLDAYESFKCFINTLQQEQLEVDIVTEYDEQFYSDPVYGKLTNRNAGIAIARHFYELGKNSK